MPTRYAACLVVVIALTAGCTTSAQQFEESPGRNATLSLSGYERTGVASPVETRRVWDRSKSWEDPGERNVTITSRARAYRNRSGTDTVVVYTTPAETYARPDRVLPLPAPEMAALATESVGDQGQVRPSGDATGRSYEAPLLGGRATVRAITDDGGETTAHVAHVVDDQAIVVVVVAGGADRATVERVLAGVSR